MAVPGGESIAKTKGLCWLSKEIQSRTREQRAPGSFAVSMTVAADRCTRAIVE